MKIQHTSYNCELTDGSIAHDERTPTASQFKFRCTIKDDNWKAGCIEFEGTCYPHGRFEGTWSTNTDQKKGEFVLHLIGCKPARVRRFFQDRTEVIEIPDYLHFQKGNVLGINEFGVEALLIGKLSQWRARLVSYFDYNGLSDERWIGGKTWAEWKDEGALDDNYKLHDSIVSINALI